MINKFAMPTAWPETVREALRAIQFRTSDVDAPHTNRSAKAERRHAARVAALEAALVESIATYGLSWVPALPNDEHGYEHVKLKPVRTAKVRYDRVGKLAARLYPAEFVLKKGAEVVFGVDRGSPDGDYTVKGFYDLKTGEFHIQECGPNYCGVRQTAANTGDKSGE